MPSRTANSRITGSISRRRATNVSTSADDRSSQCASSTTTSSGVPSPSGERAEGCQPDEEHIGRIALGDAERDVQGPALRIRKTVEAVEEREQQLMEASKCQPRLRLRTCRRHTLLTLLARRPPRPPEQRRLADPRLSAHDQGAPTQSNLIDHAAEPLQLVFSTQEHFLDRPSRPIWPASTHRPASRSACTPLSPQSLREPCSPDRPQHHHFSRTARPRPS